jgi:RES domain-containing protein
VTPLPATLGDNELVAWRLDSATHASTWASGEGAFQRGGRWNTKGVRAVYCSIDPATAILEVAVHTGFPVLDTVAHVLTAVNIAEPSSVHVVDPASLPNPNWLKPGNPTQRRTASLWQSAFKQAQVHRNTERCILTQLEPDLRRSGGGRSLRCEIAGAFCLGYAAASACRVIIAESSWPSGSSPLCRLLPCSITCIWSAVAPDPGSHGLALRVACKAALRSGFVGQAVMFRRRGRSGRCRLCRSRGCSERKRGNGDRRGYCHHGNRLHVWSPMNGPRADEHARGIRKYNLVKLNSGSRR